MKWIVQCLVLILSIEQGLNYRKICSYNIVNVRNNSGKRGFRIIAGYTLFFCTVQYITLLYGTVYYVIIRNNTLQYSTIQYSTIIIQESYDVN